MAALAPDDPRHGTDNGYNNLDCRCQPCRDAHAAHYALRRERWAARGGCENCGGGIYAKGRCHACYEYHRRTGHERPPHLARPRSWSGTASLTHDTASRTRELAFAEAERAMERIKSRRCGTRRAYELGCRCDECRSAWSDYGREARRRKAERLRSGEANPTHGKASTYSQYGCRCDECRRAATDAVRRNRRKQRAA